MIGLTSGQGPYLSIRIGVPPDRAARALDLYRAEMSLRAGDARGRWTLPSGAASLRVERGGERLESPGTSWPLRQLFGTLFVGRGMQRFRVEVELTAWSNDAVALGIRPMGPWPPRFQRPSAYYSAAERALVTIARKVVEWDGAYSWDARGAA